MLTDALAEAIVPISDRERSIEFYGNALGLTLVENLPEEVVFEAGHGTRLSLYESVGAGKSRHTVAGFIVEDLDRVVASLRERGVVFEEYDLPELKTVDGIATVGETRGAWFKDPDGNIIGVVSRPAVAR